ncbi:hypothetical protein [Ruegeria atlantica]|uniref:hypothetical protein n=1 Tax=Ruegeria atlantica TaxID=81569 RepID=UPI001C9744AA|nr:hypothetical protein [Ruegeria atlantica]
MPALIHLKIDDDAKDIDYIAEFAEQDVLQQTFLERQYKNSLSQLVFGQGDKWFLRITAYAFAGRTDIARAAVDKFLEEQVKRDERSLCTLPAMRAFHYRRWLGPVPANAWMRRLRDV